MSFGPLISGYLAYLGLALTVPGMPPTKNGAIPGYIYFFGGCGPGSYSSTKRMLRNSEGSRAITEWYSLPSW